MISGQEKIKMEFSWTDFGFQILWIVNWIIAVLFLCVNQSSARSFGFSHYRLLKAFTLYCDYENETVTSIALTLIEIGIKLFAWVLYAQKDYVFKQLQIKMFTAYDRGKIEVLNPPKTDTNACKQSGKRISNSEAKFLVAFSIIVNSVYVAYVSSKCLQNIFRIFTNVGSMFTLNIHTCLRVAKNLVHSI